MGRSLYLFVEGTDDERFIESVFKPALTGAYDSIYVVQYAWRKRKKINAFIQSIHAMGDDYFLLADMDQAPCVTECKEKLFKRFQCLDRERALIAIREIESWYAAGVDCSTEDFRPLAELRSTNELDKERFVALCVKARTGAHDARIRILQDFDGAAARRKNASFAYCCERLGL